MKEPMKEKDSPALALSEKLNVDLMRLHGACNYCGDPSGRRGGGDECSHDSELSAEATAQYRHEGKSQR